MTFSEPNMLFALLAVPVALVLAFLSRRERRVLSASLMPWRKVIALPRPKPARNPIDLETVCSILFPTAVALAMAGPTLNLNTEKNHTIIFVVDTSTSMSSRPPDGKTRTEEACSKILELAQANPKSRFTLYSSDRNEPALTETTAEEITDYLKAAPLSPQTKLQTESCILGALATTKKDDLPVVWVGDRIPSVLSPRLSNIVVGHHSRNTAIIKVNLSKKQDETQLFCSISNFSNTKTNNKLTVSQSKKEITSANIELLRPDESIPLTIILKKGEYNPTLPLTVKLDNTDNDDLTADNAATLAPLQSTKIFIDKKKFPMITAALKAGGLETFFAESPEADESPYAVFDKPSDWLPEKGILLIDPKERCFGIIDLKWNRKVSNTIITPDNNPLPAVCISGLGKFFAKQARLPVDHRLLATCSDAESNEIPLVAEWNYRGRKVLYLAARPKSWIRHPSFPLMITELAERLKGYILPLLPGIEESDNRIKIKATKKMPELYSGKPETRPVPLGKHLAIVAALMALFVMFREYRRTSHIERQR